MKQVAQNYRTGELTLLDVAEPSCRRGGLLVQTDFSLISSGTEMMKVAEASKSLVGMARARPDQVRKVVETAVQQGPATALTKAMNRLDAYTPLGYSLAGTVIGVGDDVTGFRLGDRVACAGNQYAVHAERTWVPVNLCAPIPDGVHSRQAAFTTCGSIAMQALRQAEIGLGEVAVVVGLGLIGQLLSQLLVAAGVTVVGVDLSPERAALATRCGAAFAASPEDVIGLQRAVGDASGGFGADVVFLAAGSASNAPVELAAHLARDRGRVVDIGKCSLDLPWDRYYEKELDVRFSRSYGPGRYDPTYEERGIDYPIGYVRWTEQRNMGCFLDLLARGGIDVDPLIAAVEPFAEAAAVYRRIQEGDLHGVGFLFEYGSDRPPSAGTAPTTADVIEMPRSTPTVTGAARPRRTGPVRVGFVGAGTYAKTMLLPHLVGRDDVVLRHVVTTTPLSGSTAMKKFGFEAAGTDTDAVLADETIDAVFVVTRHSSHADLVCAALEAGKAVFVEKPLAIDTAGLGRVLETVRRTGNDRLHVGFNRRFAPLLTAAHERAERRGPQSMRYLVNAGSLDAGSWYTDRGEGSRFVGEGGHFIDTLTWWAGHDPVTVSATAAGTGVVATLDYPDGSTAVVSYLTDGPTRLPKETFDAVAPGHAVRLDNFVGLTEWTGRRGRSRKRVLAADKGQRAQLDAVLRSVTDGTPMPVTVESLARTTMATLLVERALIDGGRHGVEAALAGLGSASDAVQERAG